MIMKLFRYLIPAVATLVIASCADFDSVDMQGGTLMEKQVQETYVDMPVRGLASFEGLYAGLCEPGVVAGWQGQYYRMDDQGLMSILISNDYESADAVNISGGYNWFSSACSFESRNANYWNPWIRYKAPYDFISLCNTFIASYPEDVTGEALYMVAQAHAIKAYCYMLLAPSFALFTDELDEPSVPLLTDDVKDPANNPRATLKDVYDYIIDELTFAVDNLDGFVRPTNAYIDKRAALALRARAELFIRDYQNAYDDAVAAVDGLTPYSIAEVSVPAFYKLDDHNVIWGYDMTLVTAQKEPDATHTSWMGSLGGATYAWWVQAYARIYKPLWDLIPDTDIRKQWWVDETLHSTIADAITFAEPGSGNAPEPVATLTYEDKLPFLPYTNVKFGVNEIGTQNCDEDFPFVRVEEMLLIQAEAKLGLNDEPGAKNILENFVKNYRDPSYSANGHGLPLADEIWFQRRIELWGEGFAAPDLKRLNKPVVRMHANSNWPDEYKFNLPADDPWLRMRFPQDETNTNFGIVDNTGGQTPQPGDNAGLTDGIIQG